jgi:hypothetical protein
VSNHFPEKSRSGHSWRLLTVGVAVFLLAAGIYFLFASTRESKRLEQNLIDQFGWAEEYTPAADGKIPLQRLQAFLNVRVAVQSSCADYKEVLDGIIGLEEIETDTGMTGEEKASKSIGGLKSMIGVGPKMLQFMEARNGSLQAEEMGLGEYFYIYLATYGEQLAEAPSSPYANKEEAYISTRTRNEYVQILNNQLSITDSQPELQKFSELIRQEVDALESGSHISPWPKGPPALIRDSIAPFQEQLSDLYCEGIVSIELLQKNRGFGFKG